MNILKCYLLEDFIFLVLIDRFFAFYIYEIMFRRAISTMLCILIFGTIIKCSKVSTSFYLSWHSCAIYLFWTYSIISWWRRMQAVNSADKLQFVTVQTCSSSCPCWGVECCCLISSMAAVNLSNWEQATVISVVTSDR